MGDPQVRVVSKPKDQPAKDPETESPENNQKSQDTGAEEFLEQLANQGVQSEQVRGRVRSCLGEVADLKDQKKWDDIITLLHPLEEKEPEVVQSGLDKDLRLELSFALGQKKYFDDAVKESAERDRRSRHRSLIRLARIYFKQKNYQKSLEQAKQANDFHMETYTTPDPDGLFWEAASYLLMNRVQDARETAGKLEDFQPDYPYLVKLREKIENAKSGKNV